MSWSTSMNIYKYYFILYYFIYSFFGHFLHCAFIPDLGSHGWFIIILWPDVNLLRLPQLLNEWGAIALVCCSKKSMHRNGVLPLLSPEQTLINNHPKNLCAFVSVNLCVCVLVHVHVRVCMCVGRLWDLMKRDEEPQTELVWLV